MKVYNECCKNCLMSPDRIVSPTRAKEILNNCAVNQSHFICHKATMEGKDICCHTFYKTLGYRSNLIRVMERIGGIEFVEQKDSEKLPTYQEMKGNRKTKNHANNNNPI